MTSSVLNPGGSGKKAIVLFGTFFASIWLMLGPYHGEHPGLGRSDFMILLTLRSSSESPLFSQATGILKKIKNG